MDCILAAQLVGSSGKVVGIDSTQEMVDKARRNAEECGFANAEFWQADVTHLPVASESIDAVISNGVFNLCFHKTRVLSEVFRVLKAGGRLHMADVMLENHVTPEKVRLMGSWSGCIAGAIWSASLLSMLQDAGFVEAKFHGWTGYRTSPCTQGALASAKKPR